MVRYVFREDAPIPLKASGEADAQIIGEALAKIAGQSSGDLTPSAVVEAAKNRRHPLHKHFEWDDVVAAQAYRLDQARHLIRIVRVEDGATEESPRAFLSIRDADGIRYRSHSDVKKSSDFQMAVLRQARADLETFRRRYRELQDVFPDISAAINKIDAKLNKDETRAVA